MPKTFFFWKGAVCFEFLGRRWSRAFMETGDDRKHNIAGLLVELEILLMCRISNFFHDNLVYSDKEVRRFRTRKQSRIPTANETKRDWSCWYSIWWWFLETMLEIHTSCLVACFSTHSFLCSLWFAHCLRLHWRNTNFLLLHAVSMQVY